jgi:hypothetical protein
MGAPSMTDRLPGSEAGNGSDPTSELPPPDVAAFIRYCHRRRGFAWPELYDEMCGVAARREFNGWDHSQLATLGLTFSLLDMPRLSAWVRAVLAREDTQLVVSAGAPVAQALRAVPA